MRPDINVQISGKQRIQRVAGKELTLFFAAPVAYLFLATFAAISLFVFFWGEAFFARNIADVRPLFEWMPLLLVFLCSALTMRLWSDERAKGTLEHILTQPVPLWQFVVGKFLACLALLGIALAITLPLPITVALIGDLDWGPVWAGYLATFFLGAAYISIGLFVSARSGNQIVSLILASALCGAFYLIGSPLLTDFFSNHTGEWLRSLSTGARFDAITRGVLDLPDLYYYLSLCAVFLSLNTLVLERERWAAGGDRQHRQRWQTVTALLVVNALGANLWLGQLKSLRADVTEGNLYSISPATEQYLNQLREPLLIRGYFSGKTHPLLAPLVPQMRDLLQEYEVAGNGRVRVEIIDPTQEPELEEEANRKYGIAPVPFQVADRYQASIVSSYFDVLVQYGDEYEVLGFRDLIEINAERETDVDVQLRNPEYDLTRAVKKVLQSYQSEGNLFDTVQGQLAFTAYVSADDQLPEQLAAFKQTIRESVENMQADAGERLSVDFVDPQADGGQVARQIAEDYGFQPMAASLIGRPFYFYLTLARDDQIVQIPLDDLSADTFERNLQAGIKRFASGFTKTVALVTPTDDFSQGVGGGPRFSQLESLLGAELNVEREDLSDGRVSGNADILMLLAPRDLGEKALYAVDQFLMQGGTVIAATSPYSANLSNRSLSLNRVNSGLKQWLAHMGLEIDDQLVLDPQNSAFPVPVTRNVGGFQLQELRMLDYPYFIDVRGEGLNADNPITGNLPQATLSWASPIRVDEEKSAQRTVTPLLRSSGDSWLSGNTSVMPRYVDGQVSAFTPEGERNSQLLGVISAGRFDSYFADKPSPLAQQPEEQPPEGTEHNEKGASEADTLDNLPSQISRSPESARIILFASNDFLRDQVVRMSGAAAGGDYLNTLQLAANSVDWSVEDAGLLGIRARGHFNRTLPPMEQDSRLFWESLNYIAALLALGIVALIQHLRNRARQQRYQQLLAG
ncbi:Gldg family protein [Microbulbifer sp.]|uniref:Gldg family protein n=1 Tax=Microbulbifer sp. TaxID=1908541 RepID=UPI00258C4670|nr:Gldg family protein [Microbulbifer sp.]